ncbi:presenilin-like protein At2g29900 [Coffea eugenioides]|uniref:presenilin-like protein At2g29900 n=1 Tax=Coffea eugenioides TaxID=49369 RepID=UPI000F5C716D|nr:presenilin-like protein At2g29900 [Coffea arabica]XP_027168046.1 presenilin-like protein At2g29900 [Coffea eugenioides]
MDQNQKPTSLLDTLGEEIIRILTPVSICMFLVVILVSILNNSSDSSGPSITTIASIAYSEDSSDSIWDKLKGALLNSLVFVAVVTVVTFLLVLLFYLRCTKFLKYYMGFSAFLVLGFIGGEIAVFVIKDLSFPIDAVTFMVVLFNFTVVGVLATFMENFAIFIKQGYLVVVGMLVAYWFTLLPEWTTWVLLVAMALYDLAAVLLPGGPLRLLVELAISRDEDIPALVYEARPVTDHDSVPSNGEVQRRVWRERRHIESDFIDNVEASSESNPVGSNTSNASRVSGMSLSLETNERERNLVAAEEGRVATLDSELSAPLIQHRIDVQLNLQEGPSDSSALEGIGLGSSGAIKLGLGDFIFYSVLVGRAAMYDFMTVYACYLAIIAGLGITLMLLAFYQKALPALPVSVLLGVLFYLLTRLLLENFVVQCSINLLMF